MTRAFTLPSRSTSTRATLPSSDALAARLAEAALSARVPGASVAILFGDQVVSAATGLLNTESGVTCSPDSLFQIGSITKAYIATLVMQLADDRKLDIDELITAYLPRFKLYDSGAQKTITLRHLLTHTSGIDGDFFEDTGHGDNAVARYVDRCRELPLLHQPGQWFSYCNVGYVILGRIIEKVTDRAWHEALQERLLRPLGDHNTVPQPHNELMHDVASGHSFDPITGVQVPVMKNFFPWSNGPAGASMLSSASDLLRLAALHCNDGKSQDNRRLLSSRSLSTMQQPLVDLPPLSPVRSWGLGWMILQSRSETILGHDGNTIGQSAFLRVLPRKRLAAALVTNGGDTKAFARDIFDYTFQKIAGIRVVQPASLVNDIRLDPAAYIGRYQKLNSAVEIRSCDGQLNQSIEPRYDPADDVTSYSRILKPVDESTFLGWTASSREADTVHFLDMNGKGQYERIMLGYRLYRRCS